VVEVPNIILNLTYLSVTTLAFARLAPAKTQVKIALGPTKRFGKNGEYTPLPSPDAGANTGAPHAPAMREAHACQQSGHNRSARLSVGFAPPVMASAPFYGHSPTAAMLPAKSHAFGGKGVRMSLQCGL
jgi:hypothetical protein